MGDDEHTPLLQDRSRKPPPPNSLQSTNNADVHTQFCYLVGMSPTNVSSNLKAIGPKSSLYNRATRQLSSQTTTYLFTAILTNTLLLSQVVLGAVVTGLGATEQSHLIITIIGALNTIIAGVVAYLKSRGQPMRARMYKDDLERVVDEIENSEVMWLGIAQKIQGYDEVDEDGSVTVRSEVARLTRLYDRAVRNNTANNPDMYVAGPGVDSIGGGKRSITVSAPQPIAVAAPAPAAPAAAVPPPAPVETVKDPDASPASAPPKRVDTPKPAEGTPQASAGSSSSTLAPPPVTTTQPSPTASDQPALPATPPPPSSTQPNDNDQPPLSKPESNGDKDEGKKQDPAQPGTDLSSSAPLVTPATPSAETPAASDAVPQPAPPQPMPPPRDPDESPATAPPRKRPSASPAPTPGGHENMKP